MRKYHQVILIAVCAISVISLLIYRHEYYRLRYVLEVLNIFGKPGLSEVEFCGLGFNATMLAELLHNSSDRVDQLPSYFQQIDENVYAYSSFLRITTKQTDLFTKTLVYKTDTIVVSQEDSEFNFSCYIWIEDEMTPKIGKFSYETVKSDHDSKYKLSVFHCGLKRNLGNPVAVSFYKSFAAANPAHTVVLTLITVDDLDISSNNEVGIKFLDNLNLAVCIVPNKTPVVSKKSVIEFLIFHQMIGVKRFTIYDGSLKFDTIKTLNLLGKQFMKWELIFFPLNFLFNREQTYNVVRNAVELDCIYRHIYLNNEVESKTNYVTVLSWDEFVVPRYHKDLKYLLKNTDFNSFTNRPSLSTLVFCNNQRNDPKVKPDYPDIIKKTHYLKNVTSDSQVHLSFLSPVKQTNDIADQYFGNSLNRKSKNTSISLDLIGIHKYVDCIKDFPRKLSGIVESNNLELKSHIFEGAMLKFAEDLHNNKVYRLFKTGRIWIENQQNLHDDIL